MNCFFGGTLPEAGQTFRLPGARQETPEREAARPTTTAESRKEVVMDAKYNWLIDSMAARLTLNTVALALWVVVSVGLLEIAVKV